MNVSVARPSELSVKYGLPSAVTSSNFVENGGGKEGRAISF
ncbi:MAG TPA: hypothetical protein VLX61_06695 [Anaerolineales bacterium]|nr:hypothetical protein [Anaerolineales bacterium]